MKCAYSHCLVRLTNQRRASAIYRNLSPFHTQPCTHQVQLGDSTLTMNTGTLARFADGAAQLTMGDTSVLVTAVSDSNKDGNLMVDYRQKTAAAGRVPTNMFRRELGPTESDILTSRMIDRTLRPLMPDDYNQDTMLLVNPSRAHPSRLSVVVAGLANQRILMLEMQSDKVSKEELVSCVEAGLIHVQTVCDTINSIRDTVGKPKRQYSSAGPKAEYVELLKQSLSNRVKAIFRDTKYEKFTRDTAVQELYADWLKNTRQTEGTVALPTTVSDYELSAAYSQMVKNTYREMILSGEKRVDNRTVYKIRPMNAEVNVLNALPGSSIFQRGQTQVMCTVAFDSPAAAFKSDLASVLLGAPRERKFMLHYSFPSFATNTIKSSLRANRREMGHGALAEKAVQAVIPSSLAFTTRVNSEVLESNGSSSMATVCAASLALMDAGLHITEPVCGVALGLMTHPTDDTQHVILTDLMGFEDYAGDMDFKVAGTASGLTALQMDLKVHGISTELFSNILDRARQAHVKVLATMNECLAQPRAQMKDGGPVLRQLTVPPHKRMALLGPSACNLKLIQAETGCELQSMEDGSFSVFAPSAAAWSQAEIRIEQLLAKNKDPELQTGAIYTAQIVEIQSRGVLVRLFPDQPALFIPNHQLSTKKVAHPGVLNLKVGQDLRVKFYGRDPVSGQIRLSRKMLSLTASEQVNYFERIRPTAKQAISRSSNHNTTD